MRALWPLVLLQVGMTVAFALSHGGCVSDEAVQVREVLRYHFLGVGPRTLTKQDSPLAPGAYVWSAVGTRIVGLSWPGLRLTILFAWGIALAALYLIVREVGRDAFAPAMLVVAFLFFPSVAGKWMTEGPAFALFFVAVFLHLRRHVACGAVLAAAVACRYGFLAAVPAMAVGDYLETKKPLRATLIALPSALTFFLVYDWAPPSPTRAWSVVAYCGLYAAAGLPWRRRDIFNTKNWGTCFAVGAVMTIMFGAGIDDLWAMGPVRTVLGPFANHWPKTTQAVSLWLAAFGTALFGFVVLTLRKDPPRDALERFGAAFVALFVAEMAVMPFYERYVLDVIFFLYLLLWRRESDRRAIAAISLVWIILGQAMLWTMRAPVHGPTCSLAWPPPPRFQDTPK